jgi:hypothetical protein
MEAMTGKRVQRALVHVSVDVDLQPVDGPGCQAEADNPVRIIDPNSLTSADEHNFWVED